MYDYEEFEGTQYCAEDALQLYGLQHLELHWDRSLDTKAVVGWSGDIGIAKSRAKEAKNGVLVETLIPKTGAVLFFDTMAIPADATHVQNAYKWMSYIYRPEVNAAMVNKVHYANPIPSSAKFIAAETLNDKTVFLGKEDLAKMVPPDAVNNDIRRVRTRLYTSFKTGL